MSDFLLTPVYDVLLRGDDDVPYGLYQLQLAYAEHLCRLRGYSDRSVNWVKMNLKTLVDNGYVQADVKPTKTHGKPLYYTMGPNGIAYLAGLGYDIHDAWRSSKEVDKGVYHLDHALELNDVLISAMPLHKANPSVVLESFKHERQLKRKPFKTTWQGTRFTIVPDGFLKFQTPAGPRIVLVEHDMGTEQREHFRRRIRAYISLLKEEKTPVAFTTFKGEKRVEQMREWTLAELTVTNEPKSIGVYFRFISLDPPLAPATVWLSARWKTPYDEPGQSLLAA